MRGSTFEEKLLEAIALEGILGNQKAGVINIYQKKYFKFLDHGLTLAFANTKDDFERNKIVGKIPLKDVLDIVADEKPKNVNRFQLVLDGKVFKFEATTPAEKLMWVNAVNTCKDYALRYEEQSKEKLKAIDSEIRFEESMSAPDFRKTASFNPLEVFASTAKKVVLETAIKTGVGIVKTGVHTVGNAIGDGKARTDEEYLRAKKFDQTLDYIDKKILQSRIKMGTLFKETKEATGIGIVDGLVNGSGIRDTIAKRWCLLISSKPLDFDLIDKDDEETLDNGKLPFDIEPETLYMFDDSCDDSKPLESILLKDVIDITIKRKNPDEQFYRFVLDLGEKKVNILLANICDMTKWVKAIQAARANRKEKTKSKLPTVKNIYWHLKLMADGGEAKLKAKIEKKYEKLTAGADLTKVSNIKDLIKVQEKVALELLAIINACLVNKDQKVEVVRFYMDVFHEAILNALRAYFRKNQDCLGNKDIFEIIKFLIWYRQKLKMFGDAFADVRLTEGVDTLCRVVGIRILKTNMKAIKNILKQEFDKEPEIDGRGRAATTTPGDLFSLTNETFNVLSFCNTQELGLALLDSCSMTIQNFQNGLSFMLETYDASLDHLAAFCNNTLTYMTKSKEFGKQAEQIIGIDKESIVEHFNETVFNKTFVKLGKMAYEKIAEKILTPVSEQWSKIHFLEINLEKSISDALGQLNQLLEKIHGNFTSKIEGCCLERTVTIYVQAFLDCAEKKLFKNEDFKKITKKLETDQKLLPDLFANIKPNLVETSTTPINSFLEFLTTNYAFLSTSVQNMKEQYGNAIRWSTFELLIKLRNDPLDKDQKTELFTTCEDFYKNTQKKVVQRKKTFNVFKHVEQSYDGVDTPLTGSSNGSFIDDDTVSDGGASVSSTSTTKSFALNIEGYLNVDKEEFLGNAGSSLRPGIRFEEKYFNLKRDVLYFYKEKNSEFSQGSYKLKEMTDSGFFDDEYSFFITLRIKDIDVKSISFKASTTDKRDQWLEYIKEASKLPDLGLMVELNASDVQFFKDRTKPLFDDIEEVPNLEFSSQRPGKGQPMGRTNSNNSTQRGSMLTIITDKSGRSEEIEGRRRSFDLAGPIPTDTRRQPQLGCVASFCNVFGK